MAANQSAAPIIIKKIKKGGHGHHGGAWKVAFADFVTAMMAFFLLMWLLGSTTPEQRAMISNYFNDPMATAGYSGNGAGNPALDGGDVAVKTGTRRHATHLLKGIRNTFGASAVAPAMPGTADPVVGRRAQEWNSGGRQALSVRPESTMPPYIRLSRTWRAAMTVRLMAMMIWMHSRALL